jgi:hypothetical protein
MAITTRKITIPYALQRTISETGLFIASTPFLDAAPVKRVRRVADIQGIEANFEVAFAYQTADTASSPNQATAVGAYLTANGMAFPTSFVDISSATGGAQLVRFGWIVRKTASSGTTPATAWVGGTIEYQDI